MVVTNDDDGGLTELGGGSEELLGQGEGLARHQRLVLVLQAAQLELGAGQRALQHCTECEQKVIKHKEKMKQ